MSDMRRAKPRLSGSASVLLGWSVDAPSQAVGFHGAEDGAQTRAAGAPVEMADEGHILTIAPTGAGKGRCAVIPNLLRYDGPAIVVDPKGENYRVTARARREMGHEVRVIDPFGVVGDTSDQLNPFDVFDQPGVDRDSEAMALAHLMAGEQAGHKEPFWDIWGRALLAGVIAYVAEVEEPENRHFARVRELLKNDDVVYTLASALDEAPDLTGVAREEIASFLQLVEQTRSGVLATAQSYTDVIGSAAAQESIKRTTIDLDAVKEGAPLTVYLIVPPEKLKSHGALMRLWIGALLKTVLRRTARPDYDTLFILDECAQLGAMEDLRLAMTLLRGYGVKVWAFFQDLSQVRRLYPDDWQTIVNNAAAVQAFGAGNHLMAKELSDLLGDVDAFALRALGRDRQVVAMARQLASVFRLPDYLGDAAFAGRFDDNPMFVRRKATALGR